MKALLLAGGKGTRLWPLSKKDTPKQLVSPFGEEKNLIEMTVDRVEALGFGKEDIFLVTSEEQKNLFDSSLFAGIIAEPSPRNTAPAVLLGLKKLMSLGISNDESVYVFPSDHYISNMKINPAISMKDLIMCFGIAPTRPDTGYGYIQPHIGSSIKKVKQFKEKPDAATAEKWFESFDKSDTEKYYWNSGIYAFSINSISEALKKIDKNLHDFWLNSSYDEFVSSYDTLPKESFDIMIAEKAYNLYFMVLDADSWRDIGSWQSVFDALSKNASNQSLGASSIISADSKGCLFRSDKNLTVAFAGVNDIAVVAEGDKLLILDMKNPEAMKNLIQKLEEEGII